MIKRVVASMSASAVAVLSVGLGVVALSAPAAQAADPAPALPANASVDVMPSPQINGVVWKQVIVGDTVYAGGEFTSTRPAGAAAGTNETPRTNLLAYSLSTGKLITSFNPVLNGKVKDMAVTPDQSKLIVVGAFDTVNGQTRSRVAIFDLPSGALSAVAPAVNGGMDSVAATNDTIYLGGYFSSVSGGARARIASVKVSNGQLLPFQPTIDDGEVQSLLVAPDGKSVIASGSFTTVEGSSDSGYGLARLDAVTGAKMPLPVNTEVRNAGVNSGVLRLTSDGTRFYGVGWHYGGGGNLEGYFAANWSDGTLAWIQDCHGDTYDIATLKNVSYVVSHSHYCGNSGGFPQTSPGTNRYGTAWTADQARGINKADLYGYPTHPGTPRPEILNFFPAFVPGTYTASGQAGWAVTGNDQYLVYGGEFTKVSGKAQQGIAVLKLRPGADNLRGPRYSSTSWVPTIRSYQPGQVRIQWQPNFDEDDSKLTYTVYRGDTNTVVYETTQDARFWEASPMTFTDTGLTPGSTVQYRIRATDPWGNKANTDWISTTVASNGTVDPYAQKVLQDGATKYYRLGEPSGTAVNDYAGNDNVTAGTGVGRNAPGALLNSTDPASTFNGTSNARVISGQKVLLSGPQKFSVEGWFKTNSRSGGKIISYGNSATGASSTYDRDLYLDSSSRINFSLRGANRVVIQTPTAYNDNQWHYVVGTYSQAAGMSLYVDGKQVGLTDNSLGAIKEFTGYWHVGGDGTASGAQFLNGSIDEAAIYGDVLTPRQVNAHWMASGRPSALPNQAPTADFTSQTSGLSAAFDASGSSDSDGTIASYSWSFGDGQSGTGVKPTHVYAADGTYTVTLTVTDNAGATSTKTASVSVAAPANQAPTAAFTQSANGQTVGFDGSGSSDPDGSVSTYAWDFGDGSTGTGATPSHAYAAPGSYNVILTVTDNRGATSTVAHEVLVGRNGAAVIASDTFERTVTGGWGNADKGGAWTGRGSASTFAVDGNAATMRIPAGQTLYQDLLGISSTSTQVTSQFSVDKTVDGAYVVLVGRQVGSDFYAARLRTYADKTARLYLLQGTGSTVTGSVLLPFTIEPGTKYTFSMLTTGTNPTTVAAKVWKSSDAEPASWTAQGTNTYAPLQAAGRVGVSGFLPSAASAAAPLTISWHNLLVTDGS